MKKYIQYILGILILISLGTTSVHAASLKSEISVNQDGKVVIKNAKIMQLAGKSFFARAEWNDIYLKFLIRTDDSTKITKRVKGTTNYSEIKEGHIVNVEGRLNTSSDNLDIVATAIQDLSLDSNVGTFSGTVIAVNPTANTFSLSTKAEGVITVAADSATITKGSLTITPAHIKIGDKVLSATGTYTFTTKTLAAGGVTLYQDPSQFAPKTVIGVLKSVSSTSVPTTLTVAIEGKIFTVNISAKTELLNNARKNAVLSRFVPGDSLRIYGSRIESLDLILNAEVVRNTTL